MTAPSQAARAKVIAASLRGMITYLAVHSFNPSDVIEAADLLDAFAEIQDVAANTRLALNLADDVTIELMLQHSIVQAKRRCEQTAEIERLKTALAAQETRTCETCRFHANKLGVWCCSYLSHLVGREEIAVPRTVNGSPFSCAGWTPKESK